MAIPPAVRAAIREVTGVAPVSARPLHGGCVAEVFRVDCPGFRPLVVKTGGAGLEVEAWMLGRLSSTPLPVPAVVKSAPGILIMDYVENDGGPSGDAACDEHAADLLAALHSVQGEAFGLERDTVIGGLSQPNVWMPDWVSFFGQRRIVPMADRAEASGALPPGTRSRVDQLCLRLDELLPEPEAPVLVHGDVWGGNVLVRGGRVSAFIDPAIYFASPEIELAFTTMFSTFGPRFYARYGEHHRVDPALWSERCDLYNLYSLLVHAALFGGAYGHSADRTIRRYL